MRPLFELFGKEREQRQSVKPTLEVWYRKDADALRVLRGRGAYQWGRWRDRS